MCNYITNAVVGVANNYKIRKLFSICRICPIKNK